MTAAQELPLVGAGVNRVDGARKVAGDAPYTSDFDAPGEAHATLVQSTIAAGRIAAIDTCAAEAAPGVLKVYTHLNVPRLARGPMTLLGPSPQPPMQDDRIVHHGQHVALVVAETRDQAVAAARLVRVDYAPAEPILDLGDPRAVTVTNPWGMDSRRGDVAGGLAAADVTIAATYRTPDKIGRASCRERV